MSDEIHEIPDDFDPGVCGVPYLTEHSIYRVTVMTHSSHSWSGYFVGWPTLPEVLGRIENDPKNKLRSTGGTSESHQLCDNAKHLIKLVEDNGLPSRPPQNPRADHQVVCTYVGVIVGYIQGYNLGEALLTGEFRANNNNF